MAYQLTVADGVLAYDVSTDDTDLPLVVLAHGMGVDRHDYRFLAPLLADARYRVATLDLRGCGESSPRWPDFSRTAIAGDLVALVRHLGGPAVLVGHSIAGGAATIAAADAPDLLSAVVEITPFTRAQSISLGSLAHRGHRRAMTRLVLAGLTGRVARWQGYLDLAYPGEKPPDWQDYLTRNATMLGEPDRMKALQHMGRTTPADAGRRLAEVTQPTLIVQGALDPDWPDPVAEGEAIVAALPAGVGRLEVVDGAGHYPHAQRPEQTAEVVLAFLDAYARA